MVLQSDDTYRTAPVIYETFHHTMTMEEIEGASHVSKNETKLVV